jgi:aspartate kinase
VQNVSEKDRADVSFTVMKTDLDRALTVAGKLAERFGGTAIESDQSIAKLSVVGIGMRSHSGVAERMFHALAAEKINILMISTSEIKISCVVQGEAGTRALQAIHKAFDLDKEKPTPP